MARWLARGAEGTYARVVKRLARFFEGETDSPYHVRAPAASPDVRARLENAVATIKASGNDHGLAERLADYVAEGPEVDLMYMRPLRLAKEWDVPERHTIEVCLQSVDAGLLSMDWQMLCPRCRGAKVTAPRLDGLPAKGHCDSCNVEFERDFSRNIELTFHPAAAVRPVERGEFCLFGPMSTPHVRFQQNLAPGETRTLDFDLEPGRYRFRSLNAGGEVEVDLLDSEPLPTLIFEGESAKTGPPSPGRKIAVINRSDGAQTLLIEEREWARDALTADRVTATQVFRDLFRSEVLRPGDELAIERITLMFTDLKSSTALYGRVGDAQAFQLVRRHFGYLIDIVRRHNGTLVKTIGDAVMAAFSDPADAVRAAVAIQKNIGDLAEPNDESPLLIKISLHEGSCVAVTMNERLDYFGTAVNLAARLLDKNPGGEIILSEAIAGDPGVTAILEGLTATRETDRIKGFALPVSYLRVVV